MPFDPTVPTSSGKYLNIAATSWKKSTGNNFDSRQFYALCGDNPPTITSGYGKWNVIDRPLRVGITVPTGYDPFKLHVEIRLGIWDGRFQHDRLVSGWDTSDTAANEVESNISDLHWMGTGDTFSGPSPAIYIWSGTKKNQTHLVPRDVWNFTWVMDGGVSWGQSWRNKNGKRIYQEASFDLLSYNSINVPPPPLQSSTAGGFFTTNVAVRTAFGIAGANSTHSSASAIESLARQILADGRNNPCRSSRVKLERRSIHWEMPLNLQVWVPAHHI